MILITKDDNNRIRASEVPFLAPKNGHFQRFWVQKIGLQMPETTNRDHFLSQIIP